MDDGMNIFEILIIKRPLEKRGLIENIRIKAEGYYDYGPEL